MKLMHLGDLHIGRRIGEFDLIEDQHYILHEILKIADEEKPDGVLIAGDVYDKSLPNVDAVELFDEFLTGLASRGLPVYMISGNHDSPERLGFGSKILSRNNIHIAGVFEGSLQKESAEDEYGPVNIWLLPYLKPALVRPYFKETVIESYDDALRAVVNAAKVDQSARNILVAHQFVTFMGREPERSESESLSVGGLDNVDTSAFDPFDYVALGHLHGPQRVGRDSIRYCGSPLKYSFSEAQQHKSVTIVELRAKGEVEIRAIPLTALRDMRQIRGPIDAVIEAAQNDEHKQDYIHATLTDEGELFDALGRLRAVYPNLMELDFENTRTTAAPSKTAAGGDVARKSPMTLFEEFYENQNGMELTEEERKIMLGLFEQAGGTGE